MRLPDSEHTSTAVGIVRIDIPASRREVNADTVKRIAESIEKIGLQYPITVSLPGADNRVRLISGRHRLEAFRTLGRTHIPAYLSRLNETDERLWEISENLHRAELSALERAEQIEEWRKLTADEVRKVSAPTGGAQPKESGIRATARALGVDEKEVRNARSIAALSPEAKAAADLLDLLNRCDGRALLEALRANLMEALPAARASAPA